jgi:23S rRNA (uracil1939-C5)-methyltransferase
MQKTFSMAVERIAHDGAAEGTFEGKKVHIHGMLPDEEGVVEVKKKQGIFIGSLKEITKASSRRKLPEETHFLSCSPWQVMEYPLQSELKHELIAKLFGYYDDAPKASFTPAVQFYGYRTKVEFSFCDREGENDIPLSLAFHERGGGARRLPLDKGCMLASERMNAIALAITAKLRDAGYVSRDLKTLVVRESKSEGKCIAILYAKKEEIAEFSVEDVPDLSGFMVFHSTEKSPASVPTKFLWGRGDDFLTEVMGGVSIRYSWDSFFQNNIPVFLEAVEMMKKYVEEGSRVLELYSGAGTIGLMLGRTGTKVHAVEIVPAAVESSLLNAEVNGIEGYTAEALPAEAIDRELLHADDTLLLDPPRAGLHPKLIDAIKEKQPKSIIYLSCNPETQARDYSELSALYKIEAVRGFDFYPQTPHLESLLILSLRSK